MRLLLTSPRSLDWLIPRMHGGPRTRSLLFTLAHTLCVLTHSSAATSQTMAPTRLARGCARTHVIAGNDMRKVLEPTSKVEGWNCALLHTAESHPQTLKQTLNVRVHALISGELQGGGHAGPQQP
eukprot:1152402-Pelagomonas_calceolata.AAC.12